DTRPLIISSRAAYLCCLGVLSDSNKKQAEIFANIPILQLSSPGCSRFKHPDVPVPDIRVSAYNLY
ncbi:hypothetical protein AALE46_19285, partial [Tannerellaceae bacterium 33-180]